LFVSEKQTQEQFPRTFCLE